MKKFILSILTVAVCFTFFTVMPVSAENNVSSIDIYVAVQKNGDAVVTQTWTGTFDEGTECYLPIGNLAEGMDITSFQAWTEDTMFEYVDDWDVDASFEDKKEKCGVVTTDNGYELCFGIGEYGKNTYNFSYTVKGLVGSYQDKDGFNFQFVNTQMNIYPTDVNVLIYNQDSTKPFKNSNSDIYAFGFKGQINFTNEGIYSYTESPLDSGDRYVNIVVGFNKGVLSPTRVGEQDSFDELLSTAKEGSSYGSREQKDDDDSILGIIFVGIIAVVSILFSIIFSLIRKFKIKKFVNGVNYFRETPCSDNMNIAFCLARDFDQNEKEGSIIGACLIELINKGYLEPIYDNETGFMGKEKKHINLKLVGMPTEHDRPSTKLYNILFKAAGEDGVLQEKELKKYSSKNPEILRKFIDDNKHNGELSLKNQGKYSKNINKLSAFAQQQLSELIGFKKYLLNFSLISERGIEESQIWEDYLVYATLLDISDKVIKQMKEVYPDKLPEIQTYEQNILLMNMYYHASYSAMKSAEASRNSGSGGASSFGGGGGFSGGGIGGGTR